MKKILFLFIAVIFFAGSTFAAENYIDENITPEDFAVQQETPKDETIIHQKTIQEQINNIAFKLLNANKIDKRIVFVYDETAKKSLLKSIEDVTKRQIVLYKDDIQFIANDDELAGFLARGISMALKSYGGMCNGSLTSVQVKLAPKIYEIYADKRAVDFMVKAGYDPIGLITYINKAFPQKRFDMFSNTNLTSKRLAIIYEYIYTKYPYFLKNNQYLNNEYYQNFLLTSSNNRRLLEEKIKTNSKEKIKYE